MKNIVKGGVWGLSLVLLVLLSAGCGSFKWVAVEEKPMVDEMQSVKTIGIAGFLPSLPADRHVLIKWGKDEGKEDWAVVGGYPGVTTRIVIVVKANDAAADYGVNKEKIAAFTQESWLDVLSGKMDYDVAGMDGFTMKRVASRTDKGERIQFTQDIVKIPETVDDMAEDWEITNLGKKYHVDAILGGTVEVYAEIIRSTGEENEDASYGDVQLSEGQYALKLEVYIEWALYDARTGNIIKDSDKEKSEFVSLQMAEKTIYPLLDVIPNDFRDLYRFISGTKYAALFKKSIQDKIKEYAYLFIPHYRMVQEAVKDED
jgi:hypothetical protein